MDKNNSSKYLFWVNYPFKTRINKVKEISKLRSIETDRKYLPVTKSLIWISHNALHFFLVLHMAVVF